MAAPIPIPAAAPLARPTFDPRGGELDVDNAADDVADVAVEELEEVVDFPVAI
jgi:hypothetical protein